MILTRILLSTSLAAAALPGFAQELRKAEGVNPPPASKEADYVNIRDFKSKVLFVQHGNPYQIRDILRPLGSGFRGATIEGSNSNNLKTISVRDFPENIASMEEAFKRLDVPNTLQPQGIEFHIHVLFAHKTEGPSEGFSPEMLDVLKSLKSTLNYRSFTSVTTFVQHSKTEAQKQSGSGNTEMIRTNHLGEKTVEKIAIRWRLNSLGVDNPSAGPKTISFSGFNLDASNITSGGIAELHTDISLKDGEKVVVGTSVMNNEGLIVVLTARLLK